jgi:hypothetical protein
MTDAEDDKRDGPAGDAGDADAAAPPDLGAAPRGAGSPAGDADAAAPPSEREPAAEGAAGDDEAGPTGDEPDAPESDDAETGEQELDEADESKMRDLLKGALDLEHAEPPPDAQFLRGVQKRLRERSGGKFYADGWSTAKHPPTYTYLWTSVLMLAIVVLAYATLSALTGEAVEVQNEPEGATIVAPAPRPRGR